VPRHEIRPGRLCAGTVLTATGVLYAGDAGGAWQIPWFVALPLVTGGLFLAGAVAFVAGRARRRRRTGGAGVDIP
jgi:hypothetical protein